jgi:deoxyribodipyrimidine photo-lyase
MASKDNIMTLPPVIVWFRKDLRVSDNPALQAAVETRRPILCLYILEEGETRPFGQASLWWLHYSLAALQKKIPLLCLRRGDAETILPHIMHETGSTHVFWTRRYDPEGVRVDTRLKKNLKDNNVNVVSVNGSLLTEPWERLTSSQGPFRVFTPYWKRCLKEISVARPLPSPATIPQFSYKSESLENWNLLPTKPDWASEFSQDWTPGEEAAQSRLTDFMNNEMQTYKYRRNFPLKDGTSRLSPHLHWGEISPRQIWYAVHTFQEQNPDKSQGAYKFLSEVGWREFTYSLLYHFPHLPHEPLRPEFAAFPWRTDDADLAAWQQGKTGYPLVDAGMRQLWHTGWMHNRLRMVVASFLIKHLLISWQTGEQWFWNTLVDSDPANNALSWQWVAGCGADAAPYFRIFNPVLQSEKFDPGGGFIRRWVPELEALPDVHIHRPWLAPQDVLDKARIKLGVTYPHPVVDHAAARARALMAYKVMKL